MERVKLRFQHLDRIPSNDRRRIAKQLVYRGRCEPAAALVLGPDQGLEPAPLDRIAQIDRAEIDPDPERHSGKTAGIGGMPGPSNSHG